MTKIESNQEFELIHFTESKYKYPLFSDDVPCGFPSPANDFLDKKLSLDELIVTKPAATFFLRAKGNSMVNAGICTGDILVCDRSREPSHGNIVIANINQQFTVKRLVKQNGKCYLKAENSNQPPISIGDDDQLEIIGVVTWILKKTV